MKQDEQNTQPMEPLSNPFLPDKEEFREAILDSLNYLEVTDHIVNVLYENLIEQPVINKQEGHLLTTRVGIRDLDGSIKNFHFALLTENGHVAQAK